MSNTANVNGEGPQGQTVNDSATDDIDILTAIELLIEKAFIPTCIEIGGEIGSACVPLPQGTGQVFTIKVTNEGLSDVVGAAITDDVSVFLGVLPVGDFVITGTPGASATCSDTDANPQTLECSADIPAGGNVVITVPYLVAPFLSSPTPTYGPSNSDGTNFRFVFANGSVLEGNALGPVYLDEVQIAAEGASGLTKNDFLFDPDGPGGEPAMLLHLSCSDPFTGGWGQSGGPVEGVNTTGWKVQYFSIARYKQGGQFFRNCGNVVGPFTVDNFATVAWSDSGDDYELDSNVASVTIKEGIKLDKFQNKAKHAAVELTNFTGDAKVIDYVEFKWPVKNAEVRQVTLDGAVIWSGSIPGTPAGGKLNASFGHSPWLHSPDPEPDFWVNSAWTGNTTDRTLEADASERLAVHFKGKATTGSYMFTVHFTDGTFLNIFINE